MSTTTTVVRCIGPRRGAGVRTRSGGGHLARRGRAKLVADLTAETTGETPGCDCDKCAQRGRAMTVGEAELAVAHVSAADAVTYARGHLAVVSFTGCQSCGGWVPAFIDAEAVTVT